jgi:ankyrin repeat protein
MLNRLIVSTLILLVGSAGAQSNVQQAHSLMITAIHNKDTDEIRKLAGSPWVIINETDMSPFYIQSAVITGDIPTIKTIFEVGGRILQSGQWPQGKGTNNVYLQAISANRIDVLKLLIDEFKREKSNPKSSDNPYTLPQLFAAQNNGQDALMSAYFTGHADLGLVLLENGADPNTKGFYGVSAIWFAVRSVPICQKCFTDALTYHADQNLLDPSGKTRLFRWTEYGIATNASVVQFLVDHGINVNIKDVDGLTAHDWTHIQGLGNGNCHQVALLHPDIQAIPVKAGAQPRNLPGTFRCRWGTT